MTGESKSLPDVLEAVVLGPEDRLVLIWPKLDRYEHLQIREAIAEHGLRDRVLCAAGVEDALVLRATKAEGSTVGQCGDWLPALFDGATDPSATCHLAYDHTGMHSDGSATWSNEGSER